MSKKSNGGSLRRAKTKWELDAIQTTKLRNQILEQAIDGSVAAQRLVLEYTHVKPAIELEVDHYERITWDFSNTIPSEALAAATAQSGQALQRLGHSSSGRQDRTRGEPIDIESSGSAEDSGMRVHQPPVLPE